MRAIESRNGRVPQIEDAEVTVTTDDKEAPQAHKLDVTAAAVAVTEAGSPASSLGLNSDAFKTPVNDRSPDPSLQRAPLANELRMPVPAFVLGVDVLTPTPSQRAPSPEAQP